MKTLTTLVLLALCLCVLCNTASGAAKNVILMIADGCGYNHILAADYYQYGKAGSQRYEQFPVAFGVSTYPGSMSSKPLDKGASPTCGYDPARASTVWDYVKLEPTDSAAAGTALACGVKTYNKAICKDLYGEDLKTIAEQFKEDGRAAGVVTNVPWSHATPACFVAHNITRDNYADIANEMVNSSMDVIMGAGHPYYTDDGVATTSPNVAKNQGKWIPGATWAVWRLGSRCSMARPGVRTLGRWCRRALRSRRLRWARRQRVCSARSRRLRPPSSPAVAPRSTRR